MRKLFARAGRLTSFGAAAIMIVGTAMVQAATAGPAAAAFSGQHTVHSRSPALSSDSHTRDAVCPSGQHAIGGGGIVDNDLRDKVFLTASFPLPDGSGWEVSGARMNDWHGTWYVDAYAICAFPVAGWELQWGNSGPGAARFKTTFTFKCSKGKKALSAGGRINEAPAGSVGLTMIRPDDALTIGRASARVAPAGYDGSWSVDSFAICAFPSPKVQNSGVIGSGPEVVWSCPGGTTPVGAGGGGGLVDLGQFYLNGLAPTPNGVWVRMTGASERWGTLAQVTCAS
jgi:hypothetical protein